MQGQPLSTRYKIRDESQIKTLCEMINIQLQIALKVDKCLSLGSV